MKSFGAILWHSLCPVLCSWRKPLSQSRRQARKWYCYGLGWVTSVAGRAMGQAVSRKPPTAEARVRSRVSTCAICGGQCGTGTGFSASSSAFPCQFHSTGAPLLVKGQKIIIIVIFITGSHKKPQGCGASVASAAGPFTTKKELLLERFPSSQFHTWYLYLC
jgi:hypothetical protein